MEITPERSRNWIIYRVRGWQEKWKSESYGKWKSQGRYMPYKMKKEEGTRSGDLLKAMETQECPEEKPPYLQTHDKIREKDTTQWKLSIKDLRTALDTARHRNKKDLDSLETQEIQGENEQKDKWPGTCTLNWKLRPEAQPPTDLQFSESAPSSVVLICAGNDGLALCSFILGQSEEPSSVEGLYGCRNNATWWIESKEKEFICLRWKTLPKTEGCH